MNWSHFFGCSAHILRSICFNVPLKESTNPLHIGWYGVVIRWLISSRFITSFIYCDVNCLPLSVRISSGTPNLLKIDTSNVFCCTIFQWNSFRIASGVINQSKYVAESRTWFGVNGTNQVYCYSLERYVNKWQLSQWCWCQTSFVYRTLTYTSHDLQYLLTSSVIPGQ